MHAELALDIPSFAALGSRIGKCVFVHAEIAALAPADDPAAGTEQLSVLDLDLIPPADPVLVTAQDPAGTDLVIFEQLLLTA